MTLLYWNRDKYARLVTYRGREMSLTGQIVREIEIAGTEAVLGSIADLDFTFTREVNNILPPWSGMPTVDVVGGNVPENDPFTRLEFVDLHLDLVKMRLRPLRYRAA